MRRGSHPHSDKDAYINEAGGGFPIRGTEEVLEEVEVEDWGDLDWTVCFDAQGPLGWIDRYGKLWACEYGDHDRLAFLVLKKTTEELERIGYVRVMSLPENDPKGYEHRSSRSMTDAQRKTLARWDYDVKEDWED